ncbi:MAG: hypothetical protein AAF346_00840 [Pseudomonadota bacterium]
MQNNFFSSLKFQPVYGASSEGSGGGASDEPYELPTLVLGGFDDDDHGDRTYDYELVGGSGDDTVFEEPSVQIVHVDTAIIGHGTPYNGGPITVAVAENYVVDNQTRLEMEYQQVHDQAISAMLGNGWPPGFFLETF